MRQSSRRSACRARGHDAPRAARGDLYDAVTRRIIAELEAGRVPWVQPWESGVAPGLPRNALTQRPYSGINVLILWSALSENGWRTQSWLTFRQALAAGGSVRKGARGTCVVYADRFTPGAEAEKAQARGDAPKTIAFLKRFTVFNVDQCEGLPADLAPDVAPLADDDIAPQAEALIAASGVDVRIGGSRAYYAPGEDFVQLPPPRAFCDPVNFYSVALHELSHATGHKTRLDRQILNSFGSKDYAREELVAEMGSAFLSAALGIAPTVRHADYLGAWLDVLRADNRAIFRAASAASKAADWLLARHAESEGRAA
jgi:antirestriction protein ArdC